jgi:hypothetical protein
MKKAVLIVLIAILLAVMVTATASATKPDYVFGTVDFGSYGSDGVTTWYDVCDPYLVGHVVQPAAPPGKAVKGYFEAGPSTFCDWENPYQGTCEFTLIPVENPFDPDTKLGHGVVKNCTGELAGLHGVLTIGFMFNYEARYHFDP